MTFYKSLIILTLLSTISCSTYQKFDSRESELPGDKNVSLPNSEIAFTVPANTVEVKNINADKEYLITIDIGTDAKVTCNVATKANDVANNARKYLELLKSNKSMTDTKVAKINSEVIGKTPILELDIFFNSEKDGKKSSSLLKTVHANIGTHFVHCFHDQIGYKQTFKSVFKRIVDTFTPNNSPQYDFHDIQIASLHNKNIGYVEKRILKKDGKRTSLVVSTILKPDQENKLVAIDSIFREVSHLKKSHVISGKYITVLNSRLINNLDLTLKRKRYAVSGVFNQKKVATKLKIKARSLIPSVYDVSKRLSKKFKKGLVTHKSIEFNGFLAPTKTTDSTYLLESKDSNNNYSVNKLGTLFKMKTSGEIFESNIYFGKSNIIIKQVYSDGVY